MDYKNTITVRLSKDHMAKLDGLFQYDYGVRLILKGVDLPSVYEVHFSNEEHGKSKKSIGDETGVDIPDEYLLSGEPVYFWVFLHNAKHDGYTEYSGKISVTKRAKPTDLKPTPAQQDIISQVVAAVNDTESQVTELQSDLNQLREDFDNFHETDPTVPQWAKEETKPTYTAQEVGALPDDTVVPSKTSDLVNDSGFISSETDPTVPEWAKQPEKPVYTAEEVGALSSGTYIPDKVSDLANDAGYISEETDPTVPEWAKQPTKPSYTASEVGALPSDTVIPNKTSDLTNDSGFITSESDPTVPNWAKQPNKPSYTAQEVGALPNTTIIPTKVSDLQNDSGFISQETDPTVPSWAKESSKPTYTAAEVGATTVSDVNGLIAAAIENINTFDIAIVQSLPVQNIKEHTIYFVPKQGATNDVYDEYIYVNNAWEMIGNTQIDLSDYALKEEIPEVPVQDVQIDGTSVLNNGVANVPKATSNTLGVVKPSNSGIQINAQGQIFTKKASSSLIKDGTNLYDVIVPSNQDAATFYGLAKAAGDSTQSASSNTVGNYTDEAKTAIQSMLDVPSNDDVTALSSALNDKYEKPSTGIPASDLASGVIPAVPVTDVQVAGTSVLSQGVANVPIMSQNTLGVALPSSSIGVTSNGFLYTIKATSSNVKAGTETTKPIVPDCQHQSTFYGLAKAAGADMASVSGAVVGTYPEAQKIAIQKMLGIYVPPVELIREITLAERTSLNITVDDNGNPFSLLSVFIEVSYDANLTSESSGYGRYLMYDSTGNHWLNAETGRYTTSTNKSYKQIRAELKGGSGLCMFTRQTGVGSYAQWSSKAIEAQGFAQQIGNIVRIAMNSDDYEPVGATIKVYGQRAY